MGVFDSVLTRMGAEDFIAQGRSTFMVELQEASDILVRATSRSLIIMDELGRGTSTHDGTAIAYATLRTLVQDISAFTLFVTHYQLICQLETELPFQVLALADACTSLAPDAFSLRVKRMGHGGTRLRCSDSLWCKYTCVARAGGELPHGLHGGGRQSHRIHVPARQGQREAFLRTECSALGQAASTTRRPRRAHVRPIRSAGD